MNNIHLDMLIEEMSKPGRGFANVMANLEQQILRRALDLNLGNRGQVARVLRMNRTTLVEKLKKFDMADYFKIKGEPVKLLSPAETAALLEGK